MQINLTQVNNNWVCHDYLLFCVQGQIAAEFDECKLEALLSAFSEDLPSQDLCPWLRNVFVPFVRRVIPSGQVV